MLKLIGWAARLAGQINCTLHLWGSAVSVVNVNVNVNVNANANANANANVGNAPSP
jgi:hypothetical protein